MTLAGIVSFIVMLFLIWIPLAQPDIGMFTIPAITGIIVLYAIFIVGYFVAKAYRKRQGIDISLAFKEIPPE